MGTQLVALGDLKCKVSGCRLHLLLLHYLHYLHHLHHLQPVSHMQFMQGRSDSRLVRNRGRCSKLINGVRRGSEEDMRKRREPDERRKTKRRKDEKMKKQKYE
jgi:hypothetical protein